MGGMLSSARCRLGISPKVGAQFAESQARLNIDQLPRQRGRRFPMASCDQIEVSNRCFSGSGKAFPLVFLHRSQQCLHVHVRNFIT